MGRTKTDREKRPAAIQTRLEPDEQALWVQLVATRIGELRAEGVKATASDVLRWLIRKEVERRGWLDEGQGARLTGASGAASVVPASTLKRKGGKR
jgi:hypothetical protein